MSVISPQGYIEERRVQLEAREAALPVMEKAWKELNVELPFDDLSHKYSNIFCRLRYSLHYSAYL